MFIGRIITPSKPFRFSADSVDERVGDVIGIHNLSLAPSSKEEAIVIAYRDGVQYILARLSKNCPHIMTNLYVEISEQVEFRVKGNAQVHLIGVFEPEPAFQEANPEFEEQKIQPVQIKQPIQKPKQNKKYQQGKKNGNKIKKIKSSVEPTIKDQKKQAKPQSQPQPVVSISKSSQPQSKKPETKKTEKKQQAKAKPIQQSISQGSASDQQVEEEVGLVGLEDIDDDIGNQHHQYTVKAVNKKHENIGKSQSKAHQNKNQNQPHQQSHVKQVTNPVKKQNQPQIGPGKQKVEWKKNQHNSAVPQSQNNQNQSKKDKKNKKKKDKKKFKASQNKK